MYLCQGIDHPIVVKSENSDNETRRNINYYNIYRELQVKMLNIRICVRKF